MHEQCYKKEGPLKAGMDKERVRTGCVSLAYLERRLSNCDLNLGQGCDCNRCEKLEIFISQVLFKLTQVVYINKQNSNSATSGDTVEVFRVEFEIIDKKSSFPFRIQK